MRNNLSREIGCWVFGRIVVPPEENLDRLEKRLETARVLVSQCRMNLTAIRAGTQSDTPLPPTVFKELAALARRYEIAAKEIELIKLQLQYPQDAVLFA